MKKRFKRFKDIYTQVYAAGVMKIFVDTETGVHYLIGHGVGLNTMTPLLDSEGKVVIKKPEN